MNRKPQEHELFNVSGASEDAASQTRGKSYRSRRRREDDTRKGRYMEIGSLIGEMLDGLGITCRVKESRALLIWRDVVGDVIGDVTEPRSIRRGVLRVKVRDPVWRNELTYLKDEIIDKLNRSIGEKVVSDVKFS